MSLGALVHNLVICLDGINIPCNEPTGTFFVPASCFI